MSNNHTADGLMSIANFVPCIDYLEKPFHLVKGNDRGEIYFGMRALIPATEYEAGLPVYTATKGDTWTLTLDGETSEHEYMGVFEMVAELPDPENGRPSCLVRDASYELQRAREEEVLPSPYPGAIARRINGLYSTAPSNLWHEIELDIEGDGALSLTKFPGGRWTLDIDLTAEVDVAAGRQLCEQLRAAVDLAARLDAEDDSCNK